MAHREHAQKTEVSEETKRLLPSFAVVRELAEQLILIFCLVFLFRTFAAEAFVIPTGSMAPTLQGRHKDVTCPKCGFAYAVGEIVDPDGNLRRDERTGRALETVAATCPMCRYSAVLNEPGQTCPSCNGDRVEVDKTAYQHSEPERWDVVVFRFPGDLPSVPPAFRGDARTNYIKRLIGLPGETIRIQRGDIFVSSSGATQPEDADFSIARKPPSKLLAMLQPVFDNDFMPQIARSGWPARWQPDDANAEATWTSENGTTFTVEGSAGGEHWLRYRHLVPSHPQWRQLEADPSNVPRIEPQLITDFTAYDTNRNQTENPSPSPSALGVHWVGDLAIACTAESIDGQGVLTFELREGGRRFQCRFDLTTGQASLSITGQDMSEWHPTAQTSVQGQGRHDILFSNCDNQLLLWVDGQPVSFDQPTAYDDLQNIRPDESDLSPVGVAASDARVRIDHLRVLRDIYYLAIQSEADGARPYDVQYRPDHARPDEFWLPKSPRRHVDFPLAADQFFVLGDNSATSKDGRLWGWNNHWVPRELLIGKGLVLSWPCYSFNVPWINTPFPYYPDFDRMGRIR